MHKKREFEQVSLEVVKKVVEEHNKKQMTESDREIKKKELEQLEQLLVEVNGKGGKR